MFIFFSTLLLSKNCILNFKKLDSLRNSNSVPFFPQGLCDHIKEFETREHNLENGIFPSTILFCS